MQLPSGREGRRRRQQHADGDFEYDQRGDADARPEQHTPRRRAEPMRAEYDAEAEQPAFQQTVAQPDDRHRGEQRDYRRRRQQHQQQRPADAAPPAAQQPLDRPAEQQPGEDRADQQQGGGGGGGHDEKGCWVVSC